VKCCGQHRASYSLILVLPLAVQKRVQSRRRVQQRLRLQLRVQVHCTRAEEQVQRRSVCRSRGHYCGGRANGSAIAIDHFSGPRDHSNANGNANAMGANGDGGDRGSENANASVVVVAAFGTVNAMIVVVHRSDHPHDRRDHRDHRDHHRNRPESDSLVRSVRACHIRNSWN